MDFFNIGPGELLLIIVIALIVFGPGKIVSISRDLGKALHAFRKASSDLTAQITKEIDLEEKGQNEKSHLPPDTTVKPKEPPLTRNE
jgi:sec-independent protein translocase protein TatA